MDKQELLKRLEDHERVYSERVEGYIKEDEEDPYIEFYKGLRRMTVKVMGWLEEVED